MPLDYGSMSIPGASALGLSLQDQVAGETDEERKKRMAALDASRRTGLSPGASTLMGTGLGSLLSGLGGAAGFGR
jgi:hypothetical protein